MRDAFDVCGDDIEFREAVHQRTDVVLIHDQQMPERELSACGVDGDNAGLEFFDCVDDMLAVNGVSGQVKALFFRGALEYDAACLFAEARGLISVHGN